MPHQDLPAGHLEDPDMGGKGGQKTRVQNEGTQGRPSKAEYSRNMERQTRVCDVSTIVGARWILLISEFALWRTKISDSGVSAARTIVLPIGVRLPRR